MSRNLDTRNRIYNDIRNLSAAELQELYGIEIEENGQVFDIAENRTFKHLSQWAEFIIDQEDNCQSFQKMTGRHYFDDEY